MIILSDIWWVDPGWWLAIFLGIVGSGIIAFLIYRRQRARKQISYQVLSDAPIVNIDRRVEDRVKILFEGNEESEEINDANLVTLKVWNSGDTDIKIWSAEDTDVENFEIPIRFIFPGRKVVSLTELEVYPSVNVIERKNLEAYLRRPSPEPHSIGLPRCFLKPGQSISISILLEGSKGRIIQRGKLFAGNIIEFDPIGLRNNQRRFFLFSLYILLLVVIIAFGITAFNSSYNRKNSVSISHIFYTVAEFDVGNGGIINSQLYNIKVFELGSYPVGSKVNSSLIAPKGAILLIIRHNNNRVVVDTIFKIPQGGWGSNIISDTGYEEINSDVFLVDVVKGNTANIDITE